VNSASRTAQLPKVRCRSEQDHFGPRILKAEFDISEEATADTYFDYDCATCMDWKHGAVFVNGFNIGRYHQAGPQKTLYIPGVLFEMGKNTIHVFENYLGDQVMKFTDTPNYGVPTVESSRKVRTGVSNDLP
jgi:beta-galactosidase